mmetsp:Transcript_8365/g.13874  ORF Transcript_8365/g.13874 Transcript_8365/m.13874 type:complete len:473 (+) Transcript_8365:72-1490(+)
MGSGTSNLSKEQSVTVTKELKAVYEKLQSEGKADAEIQAKLAEEYTKIVDKLTNSAKLAPSENSLKTSASSPSVASAGNAKAKKAPTRRRSFDQKGSVKGTTKKAAVSVAAKVENETIETKEAPTAADAPADKAPDSSAEPEPQADSWDSVTQQPFCELCQMAFKSMAFLERHVKYSDLHIKNVKKKEAAETASSEAAVSSFVIGEDGIFPTSESGKLMSKQVEGKHYKLLYHGSKLFWRTQDTLDLNIYHHLMPATVEVIGYDASKGKELNRLYLNYIQLDSLVKLATGESSYVTSLTRYIIQRLQLSSGTANKRLEYLKLASDMADDSSPLLDRPPIVLIPITVTRRRRTNAEEIEKTMTHLENDRAELAASTAHAHKVSNAVYSGANAIAKKKWWADFNPVRKRWIWAIRRVIRQRLVAETHAVLKALEESKRAAAAAASASGGAAGGTGSSSKKQRRTSMLKSPSKEV